ncbi:transcriptional regulator, MarR family protein [Sagittula stellata E-37]|uniref:Transcriptional regulator, MarR family protein n=2 Tax=Sagittula stellata TaxID=52603 RepID=A3KAY3_SAGS3|nr:transcriptional regulator, MarR family protein [Sagittula stellata E-37]
MFCFALYSATHAMQQAYRPLLEEIGLTYPQYLVMSALWTADKPLSVSGIGRQVQLESSTLTPLLKRLETAGHIVRRRNPEDERQLQVDLTDEGRALQARAAHIPACILEKTGLDIETLRRLQGEIRDLTHHLRTGTEDA